VKCRKGFGKNCAKVSIFLREKGQKLPHLDNEFLKVARGKARSQEISTLLADLKPNLAHSFQSIIASTPT
jgi:hypothetical protein